MDHLTNPPESTIWIEIGLFLLYRFLGSESGIGLIRNWLWVPVRVQMSQSLTVESYSHIMHLSGDFHDSTNSADIYSAFVGASRLIGLVENVLFQTVPMFIDMVLAFAYLTAILGPYEGFITLAAGVMFVYVAAKMVAGRDKMVRQQEDIMKRTFRARINGIKGWQTVCSFNQIQFECKPT